MANGELIYSYFNKNYKIPSWKKILIVFTDFLILMVLLGVITLIVFIVDAAFDYVKPVVKTLNTVSHPIETIKNTLE